uniref:Uncharacterized protein n=1 Tax=Russula abietina TaxID=482377 RepID=A0A2S0U3N3_9AGAM|nr:hypothetical protein [Russula abietina]AWB36096.1 hypothetical protein [Russula abietina]
MIFLNYIWDNDVVLYPIFLVVIGTIGYLFIILYFKFYSDKVDKGTQTSAWEGYLYSASPIIPNLDIQSVSDINPIYLHKILEIMQLYAEQLINHGVTTSELTSIINSLPIERLSETNFNELILTWINSFGG